MDLQRLGCHDEISSIRADALSQFSERGFDVSCNLVPLSIDEPGRDPGDQMLKGRAALQSDCARPQLQSKNYQCAEQHQRRDIKKQPVCARRGSCRQLTFHGQ